MLVEFSVKNFRSFRGEQVLSLVAGNDTALGGNCVTEGKLRLLKSTAIYGPNASGKSNLIKAIGTMRDIVLGSANVPSKKLPVQPFLLDDKSQKEPSSFEIIFYHGDMRYQYGFSATDECIHEEWLLVYPKGRARDNAQTWYHRTLGEDGTVWKFGSFLKGKREQLKTGTRNHALLLSVAAQLNNKQLTVVYEWFKNNLRIVPSKERLRPVTAEMLLDSEKENCIHEFVNESLKDADLGIAGVNVNREKRKIDRSTIAFPKDMSEEAREELLESLESRLKVEMLHQNDNTDKSVYLPLADESDGTQRFFQLMGPWLEAVVNGYTVFIDELEASLHPLLTRELIKFFQESEVEMNAAQLIFATHDTTLLDPDLFRRDQIWFTEKDEDAATQLYSMSDYKERKPRKGEAMQKGYLSGRYGAVPILEAFSIPNG